MKEPVIVFTPELLLQAIIYHILDSKMADGIDVPRRRVAAKRIQKIGPVKIKRAEWEAMKNDTRLRWLLAVTRTQVTIRDRTALFWELGED